MRKIIITSGKYIPSKGIHGPVLSPYMETKKDICKMLGEGIEVVEILSNGEHRKLDRETTLSHDENEQKLVINSVIEPTHVTEVKQEVVKQHNNKKDKKKNKKRSNKDFEIDMFEMK